MFFRGKDDLTKEIEEYYHSVGDYTHDKDEDEIYGAGLGIHDRHSVEEEVAEGERKKFVNHSKHTFAEEIHEAEKKTVTYDDADDSDADFIDENTGENSVFSFFDRLDGDDDGDENEKSDAGGEYNRKSDDIPHSYGNSYGRNGNFGTRNYTGRADGKAGGKIVPIVIALVIAVSIISDGVRMLKDSLSDDADTGYTEEVDEGIEADDYTFLWLDEYEEYSNAYSDLPYIAEAEKFARFMCDGDSVSINALTEDDEIISIWDSGIYFYDDVWAAAIAIYPSDDVNPNICGAAMYDIQQFMKANCPDGYAVLVFCDSEGNETGNEIWISADYAMSADEYTSNYEVYAE